MNKTYIFILRFSNNNFQDSRYSLKKRKLEIYQKYKCRSVIQVLIWDTSIATDMLLILKYLCIIDDKFKTIFGTSEIEQN